MSSESPHSPEQLGPKPEKVAKKTMSLEEAVFAYNVMLLSGKKEDEDAASLIAKDIDTMAVERNKKPLTVDQALENYSKARHEANGELLMAKYGAVVFNAMHIAEQNADEKTKHDTLAKKQMLEGAKIDMFEPAFLDAYIESRSKNDSPEVKKGYLEWLSENAKDLAEKANVEAKNPKAVTEQPAAKPTSKPVEPELAEAGVSRSVVSEKKPSRVSLVLAGAKDWVKDIGQKIVEFGPVKYFTSRFQKAYDKQRHGATEVTPLSSVTEFKIPPTKLVSTRETTPTPKPSVAASEVSGAAEKRAEIREKLQVLWDKQPGLKDASTKETALNSKPSVAASELSEEEKENANIKAKLQSLWDKQPGLKHLREQFGDDPSKVDLAKVPDIQLFSMSTLSNLAGDKALGRAVQQEIDRRSAVAEAALQARWDTLRNKSQKRREHINALYPDGGPERDEYIRNLDELDRQFPPMIQTQGIKEVTVPGDKSRAIDGAAQRGFREEYSQARRVPRVNRKAA